MVFYLPLFTATFLWYYTINIYGVIDWSTDNGHEYKTSKYYNLGFYEFNIPPLEIGFLFLCLYCMVSFCKLIRDDWLSEREAIEQE